MRPIANKQSLTPSEQATYSDLMRLFVAPLNKRYSALSHLDCMNMRRKLPSLRDEDIPFYLGAILADLIYSARLPRPDMNDVDLVLIYLDPFGLLKDSDVQVFSFLLDSRPIENQLAPYSLSVAEVKMLSELMELLKLDLHTSPRESDRYLVRDQLFSRFSLHQVRSILDWLNCSTLWGELRIDNEVVSSASLYWQYLLSEKSRENM